MHLKAHRLYTIDMKILVTGCHGQLGRELHDVLDEHDLTNTVYIGHDNLDLSDAGAVTAFLENGGFTHGVNCAAYTAVDRAEEEKSSCTAVNVEAVRNLAIHAERLGLKIIHISTDYVYDGTAHTPYTEAAKTSPLSHYGDTKRKGETALLGLAPDSVIIRTQWLYSPYSDRNFISAILRKARQGDKLRVVSDQSGTPTYARDLAEMIYKIIEAPQWVSGIYHYSNEGVASWYDFACAIVRMAGLDDVEIKPIHTSDYQAAATRPMYALLDKSLIRATYGVKIPHWQQSLAKAIARMK